MMGAPSTPDANAAMAQSRSGTPDAPDEQILPEPTRLDADFLIGSRVARTATCRTYDRQQGDPVYRPLRIYALDPSASVLDGALAVINVPYEPIERGPRGPRGAILEIEDSTAGIADTQPIDLDAPFVLMQQGRTPSPEDSLFRQQMAYAVCTSTYAAFRQALGREVAWDFSRTGTSNDEYRLRIRPAVPELQNAFYDRARGELVFGEFTAANVVAGRNVPRGRVSLCLSHDVVVHEMSHALLDALRSHFLHPSNLDVLAFHEAFADLMALFQRFTYRDVVRAAIRRAKGNITSATLLTDVAVQFAQAMDATSALRSAVRTDSTYEDAREPHRRGEVLVAAVFEAFTTVYERKTLPLVRLASGGTGVLPEGEIPDVLADRLSDRAARLASQFLTICIRAIDYCPPVDITFGEYLRAVITADADLVPHDEHAYREAWIDAFAKRRIYPLGVRSLSESELRWCPPQKSVPPEVKLSFASLRFDGDPGRPASAEEMLRQAQAFGRLAAHPRYRDEFGLAKPIPPNTSELDGDEVSPPVVESIRSSRRVGPSGQVVFDLIAEISQRRRVLARKPLPGFDFFGGATVVLDPRGQVRYVIRKSVLDEERLRRQLEFVSRDGAHFFGDGPDGSKIPQPKLLLRLHEITRPQLRMGVGARAFARGRAATEAIPPTRESPAGARAFSQDLTTALAPDVPRRYLVRAGDSADYVPLLKRCLNACVDPSPPLDSSLSFDTDTERAVTRFQSIVGAAVDGIVGPATWTFVAQKLRALNVAAPIGDETVPEWIRRLLVNDPRSTRLTALEPQSALELYEFTYGALTSIQREGFMFLLQSLKTDTQLSDLRWGAYMLATVKHECADTWRPIEEFGKGAGHTYGEPVMVEGPDGEKRINRYYGRGYVQLTWQENYRSMGHAIGLGDKLMIQPELALESATAYEILSHGMRHGTFTGRALANYIDGDKQDYVNARRIVNGIDQAERISGYAGRLHTLLLASTAPAQR